MMPVFHRNPNRKSVKPQSNKLTSIFNNFMKAKAEEIPIADLSTKDAVVAVMGPTGTGKSTFIEIATGVQGKAGHSLESCTSQISVVKLSFPGVIDSDICFVDTPGFDDTRTSDAEIFKMISEWLNDTYKRQIQLTGLLYFHRISDNRMAGTPLKNLRMFEKLCGENFERIVLTTTMWDEVETEVGDKREDQLKTEYWRFMIDRGSSVRRFLNDQKSAFDILAPIIDEVNSRGALLLQTEMNELGLQLNQTTAGRKLYSELGELVSRHQMCMERIRRELKEPTLDPEQLEVLMNDYQKISDQLQRATEDLKKMKISVGDRIQRVAKTIDWSRIIGVFWFKKKKPSQPTTGPTLSAPLPRIDFSRENDVSEGSESLADGDDVAEDDEEPVSKDTKRYTAEEKGKAVERGDWAGPPYRASHNQASQQRDGGGMARQWAPLQEPRAEATITLQKEKEEREAKEMIRQKEWQRKQDSDRQRELEARERELAQQREREREKELALQRQAEWERETARQEMEKEVARQREREKELARHREMAEREAKERERVRQQERERAEREAWGREELTQQNEWRENSKESARRRERDGYSKGEFTRQDSRIQQRASDGPTSQQDTTTAERRARARVADRESADLARQLEQTRIKRDSLIADEEQEREWARAEQKRETVRQKEMARQQEFARQQEMAHQEDLARQKEMARQKEFARQQEMARQEELARQKEMARQNEFARQQEMARQQDLSRQQQFVRQQELAQQELARQEFARQQEFAQAEVAQAEWARRQEEKTRADDWTRQGRYRPEEEWTTGEERARADEWPRRGSMAVQDELDRGSAERARGRAERERAKAERERAKERAQQARSYRQMG